MKEEEIKMLKDEKKHKDSLIGMSKEKEKEMQDEITRLREVEDSL